MENNLEWDNLKNILRLGDKISGKVIRHEPYGIFVDIGYEFDGLISIIDFKDEGRMTPEQYPMIGSEISAVILGFKDFGHQVWLGVKPSQFNGIL